jgi:hypothetical protein
MDKRIVTVTTAKGKAIRYVDGYSEQVWRSLAVKSLRIGWSEGNTAGSAEVVTFHSQGADDMWLAGRCVPAVPELQDCLREIADKDFDALCERETHHDQRLHRTTSATCRTKRRRQQKRRSRTCGGEGKKYGLLASTRSLNCWYSWLRQRRWT